MTNIYPVDTVVICSEMFQRDYLLEYLEKVGYLLCSRCKEHILNKNFTCIKWYSHGEVHLCTSQVKKREFSVTFEQFLIRLKEIEEQNETIV